MWVKSKKSTLSYYDGLIFANNALDDQSEYDNDMVYQYQIHDASGNISIRIVYSIERDVQWVIYQYT